MAINCAIRRSARSAIHSPAAMAAPNNIWALGRKHRNDPEAGRVDDYDLILGDEHPMPAETRKDTHDVLRDANEPDSPRYHGAYAYVEINAVHPRDIASRHDDVVNACALVRRDIYIDVSPVPGI